MPYDLTARLVVGVASSALFDLSRSNAVYEQDGLDAFRAHQRDHLDIPLDPGVAFPFVRRLLGLNQVRPEDPPVEVVLLSRNDAETGRRAFRSAAHHGLSIERAAFLHGESPHSYLGAFDCELFLSANEADVRAATAAGAPAGVVLNPSLPDVSEDPELRIAFDFDGVLVDDASERVFAEGGLDAFRAHEIAKRAEPLAPGPLKAFFERVAGLQRLEAETAGHAPRLKTALVTARGGAAYERVVETLEAWGLRLDQSFFLGGVEKTEVLKTLRPHIYFDDQRAHLDRARDFIPAVHVPFGVRNLG